MGKQFTETIHSDFLIYWTGKEFNGDWDPEKSSNKLSSDFVNAYIERLKSILKYGLWMMGSNTQHCIEINGQEISKPSVARTCFTELKLSEVRKHAYKFGRLGIGVKRYFLFDRLGGPMKYVQFKTHNLSFPPYSNRYAKDSVDYELLSFYKHMCSTRPLTYDLFSESEWRIIYSENIKKKLQKYAPKHLELFKDPTELTDSELRRFYDNIQGSKPEYFLPLDAWLSIIIYPSPEVKNEARKNTEISNLIRSVKTNKPATGCPLYEHDMWPIEVDLDACSHF
jgi:hypothetical protein